MAFLYLAPAGPEEETFVEIPAGSTTTSMAARLERAGIIRSRYAFDLLRVVKGGKLKAGEYRFDHPATMAEVYARIARGDVFTRVVTIPEGANIFEIAARLEGAKLGTAREFLAETKDTRLISDLDPQATSLEGYLFPDTYHFPRLATPHLIAATMVKRFRAAASAVGLRSNYHQAITMASLIEKETPIPSERPLVAGVFENRLQKGMALMTDPSVIYGLELEGRYRGTIYQSDLANDSPYNTYKHTGLPPGPVCNPGLESMRAAIEPAQTDYFYFVAATADPSGHSRFARTLEEHQKNVAAYRRSKESAARQ